MLRSILLASALAVLPLALACAQDVSLSAPPPASAVPSPTPAPACPGNPDALGTARMITIDPATMPPVGLQTYPQTLDLTDHEVVLTFDDGPSARTTPRVLAALEHECVKAAFFLIGRNAQTARALVKREIADGDLVGHHSWSHPAVTERGLPEDKAVADIDRGFAADDVAAYGSATGAPRIPVFRFPGFGDSPALLDRLKQRHVAVLSADLWASDWLKQTPEEELALLAGRLDKAGRGIILLHDIKEQTAAMLPAFLAMLKAKHYRVVGLAIGPGPTPIRPAPSGWSSATEKTLQALLPKLLHRGAARKAPPADHPEPTAAPPAVALPLDSGPDPMAD